MSDQPLRIALDTLGCKLNQAETETLARQFADAGYRVVAPSAAADVYILNTCTVTQVADRKSRHLLRLARRRNPAALLIATGCYAARDAQALQSLGLQMFASNGDKSGLVKQVRDIVSGHGDGAGCGLGGRRTRSFVKVQEGCSHFCSYCIVPLVRGPERSVPADQVLRSIRQRASEGCQEVVLTGTRAGAYAWEGADLTGLLKRVLKESAIPRVRLSSLQPREITPGLLDLWRDSRLCPHFHLALQSGSDQVLARMKRRYTASLYEERVSRIREAVPDVAITTDIIVGFPGETAAEFQQSYDFCQRLGFARIHVFSYSARAGTAAALMKPGVGEMTKKQRSRMMLELGRRSLEDFQRRFAGRVMPVLFESASHGVWSGLTGNYIRVSVRSEADQTNRLVPVRLVEASRETMTGELARSVSSPAIPCELPAPGAWRTRKPGRPG